MSIDVEDLLRETPAPPMSLSPATVLGAAKQDLVRRRRRFAGLATAGVAAAAAVAITVGVVGGETSAPHPMPATQTPVPTNTLNLKDPQQATFFGPSAGLPLGEIASSATEIWSDPTGEARTPVTRYVVTRVDGVLRLSRLDGTQRTLLPLVEKLPDGGSITTDRKQTLTVHPLPTNVRSAEQVVSRTDVDGGGTTMPDGSKVGVFWTGDPMAASNLGVVWWYTNLDGEIGASSGERAKMVGMQIRHVTIDYWEFTKAGVCGIFGTFGMDSGLMDDGQCPTRLHSSGDQVAWTQTADGPISDLQSTLSPDVKDQIIESAKIPGTSRVVLWAVGTKTGNGITPVTLVTWTGPDGKEHSSSPASS